MATEQLPSYLASAKPNPNRAPWYATIAPSYAGIFLWIAFYDRLPESLRGGLGASLLGLLLAAVLSYLLFYRVFGILGMKTGLPLYVVGSSTFGTKGGYLFPGIFMGLLQIGWYSVGTFFASQLLLKGFNLPDEYLKTVLGPEPRGFNAVWIITTVAWGYIFATIGAFGVKYVAKVSQFFPVVALAMLLIAAGSAVPHVGQFKTSDITIDQMAPLAGALLVLQMVVGFFATAGAAGVDFGTAARNKSDVAWGGWTGVALAVIVAGGLAIITVAGAHGKDPSLTKWAFQDALSTVNPRLASMIQILLAVGSVAPACFCASIIGNSLSTMIPSLPRVPLTLAGATIGVILAALGLAGNLEPFFGLIGASFGPICGAMVADYLLSGRKWAGPRAGISIAGYAAWILGFAVGISNNSMIAILPNWHPAAVYSFVVGFVVYAALAAAGLQGKPVAYPHTAAQQ